MLLFKELMLYFVKSHQCNTNITRSCQISIFLKEEMSKKSHNNSEFKKAKEFSVFSSPYPVSVAELLPSWSIFMFQYITKPLSKHRKNYKNNLSLS